MNFVKIDKLNIEKFIQEHVILLFEVRKSRLKSLQLAIMEAYCLLKKFNPIVIKNPPLSDVKGIFALAFHKIDIQTLREKFDKLGYSFKVLLVSFCNKEVADNKLDFDSLYSWKGKTFQVSIVFEQDVNWFLAEAPDRREFAILDTEGKIKKLMGYRGNGKDLGRRALPVEDCRMMVNLAMLEKNDVLLDPFAGGGGIIYQAYKTTTKIISNDIDPILKPGLEMYGAKHYIGKASDLVLDEPVNALVTEVPFFDNSTNIVIQSIIYLAQFLTDNAKIIIMTSNNQKEEIKRELSKVYFYCFGFDINRKGTLVSLLYFTKSKRIESELSGLYFNIKDMF